MPQTNRTTGPPSINDDGSRFPGKCNHNRLLGKVRFFLGGGGGLGPQRGGSSVKVSTKGGGPYPLFQLFKGRVTPFPEFLMGIFVMLFSIFL